MLNGSGGSGKDGLLTQDLKNLFFDVQSGSTIGTRIRKMEGSML